MWTQRPHLYYSARDADATWRIKGPLMQAIKEAGMEFVHYIIDSPVLPQAAEMMDTGMPVDVEHFTELSAEYLERLQDSSQNVCEEVGGFGPFNPNSRDHVADLLYSTRKLGYPVTRWTKAGNPRRDPNSGYKIVQHRDCPDAD